MLAETFAEGNSFIHRLDPRVKVVAASAFSILAAISDQFAALIVALILAIALVSFAKLPWRAVGRRLVIVNGFLLLLWLVVPITLPGTVALRIGPLEVTREGVIYAMMITVKSNAIILACIALLSTSHITAMGRALSRLHVPDKIVHVLLFMVRYLGIIHREYLRRSTAIRVNGFRPGTNLHTYRTYANMVGMLLIGSYEMAETVYAAMLCRGFSGEFWTLEEFEMRDTDILFCATMAVAMLLMGLLQWAYLLM